MADLEHARDKEVNKLKRKAHQALDIQNYNKLEDDFICVKNFNANLSQRIDNWIDLLDKYEEDKAIYPDWGILESRYTPGYMDFDRRTAIMKEVQQLAKKSMEDVLL